MLGSCAGARFRKEARNEQETTHAGADHRAASGCRNRPGERQDSEDGDPGPDGISEQTYYRWRKDFRERTVGQTRQFKELQKENARLKRALVNLKLDKLILEETAEGNL